MTISFSGRFEMYARDGRGRANIVKTIQKAVGKNEAAKQRTAEYGGNIIFDVPDHRDENVIRALNKKGVRYKYTEPQAPAPQRRFTDDELRAAEASLDDSDL